MSSRSRLPALPLVLWLFSSCSDTAVELTIHYSMIIPKDLDAICLQIVTGTERRDFGQRYGLTEGGQAGKISVVAGDQVKDAFEVILTGERRGLEVSFERKRVPFVPGSITQQELWLPRCKTPGIATGTGSFLTPATLTNDGPALAMMPVLFAPSSVLALTADKATFYSWNSQKALPGIWPLPLPSPGTKPGRTLAVDVDGDCDLDLIFLTDQGPQLWRHEAGDAFQKVANAFPVTANKAFQAVAAARLDQDDHIDLVLVGPNLKTVLLLNSRSSPGRFEIDVSDQLSIPEPEQGAVAVAVGLLNDDPYPDLVLARGSSLDVLALSAPAGGAWTTAAEPLQVQRSGTSTSVVVADLNNDRLNDVVLGLTGSEVLVYFNSPGNPGTLVPRPTPITGTENVRDLLAVDVDNDCDRDLILARDDDVLVLNNQAGDFNLTIQPEIKVGASQLVAGDLDGDGFIDLVTTSPSATHWYRQQPLGAP